jgi:hypothetical protein
MDANFKERTRQLWERRAGRPLTDEEVRQIAENLAGFFSLLIKWERGADNDQK